MTDKLELNGTVDEGFHGLIHVHIDPQVLEVFGQKVSQRRLSFIPIRENDNFNVKKGDKVKITIEKV